MIKATIALLMTYTPVEWNMMFQLQRLGHSVKVSVHPFFQDQGERPREANGFESFACGRAKDELKAFSSKCR